MVQLGDHFPSEQRRAFIESALKPGCVVRLVIKFPEITKPKFLVLVSTDDPEFLTFIVNSEINPFIKKRPHLLQCQVVIEAASHSFLRTDSHVACHEVWPIKKEEVVHALLADMSGLKGDISAGVRARIIEAVKVARTIDRDKKSRIIVELEGLS